jgi:hypothetical protein
MAFEAGMLNPSQCQKECRMDIKRAGNANWGSITVLLTSCLTGLDYSVLQIKTKNVSCHTADSKQVKQEVNSTVTLPPFVFPAPTLANAPMQ